MSTKRILSIIVPVYNEENFIVKTLLAITKAQCMGFYKEVIIVDDASSDRTIELINDYLHKYSFSRSDVTYKLVKRTKNEGKSQAVKQGILQSTGEIVIIQDADLEYSPKDYPAMLNPFIEYDADVVYGSRFISNSSHRVLYYRHYLANFFLTHLSNLFTNVNLSDIETGYKAFKGNLIRKLGPHIVSRRYGFEPEITAKIAKVPGLRIYEVGISYKGRTYAEGKKIKWHDGVRAVFEILRFNLLSK